MTEQPKRAPGRPKKSAVLKPQQFSVRLPFLPKQILEAIARHRGISLSQAVEYAIQRLSHDYEINGRPVLEVVREAIRNQVENASDASPMKDGKVLEIMDRLVSNNSAMGKTEVGRIMWVPRELMSEEERFIADTMFASEGIPSSNPDEFLEMIRTCFAAGMSVSATVEILKLHTKGRKKT